MSAALRCDRFAGRMAESLVALDPHYRGLIFSAPSQIHLTLAFFAAVDPATADLLEEKLAAISFRAFFLPVTGLGTLLEKRSPHVLWIGVGHAHPHLFQLHKRVNEAALACNLPIEERAWTPHFTIARGRNLACIDAIVSQKTPRLRRRHVARRGIPSLPKHFNARRPHPPARAYVRGPLTVFMLVGHQNRVAHSVE